MTAPSICCTLMQPCEEHKTAGPGTPGWCYHRSAIGHHLLHCCGARGGHAPGFGCACCDAGIRARKAAPAVNEFGDEPDCIAKLDLDAKFEHLLYGGCADCRGDEAAA